MYIFWAGPRICHAIPVPPTGSVHGDVRRDNAIKSVLFLSLRINQSVNMTFNHNFLDKL